MPLRIAAVHTSLCLGLGGPLQGDGHTQKHAHASTHRHTHMLVIHPPPSPLPPIPSCSSAVSPGVSSESMIDSTVLTYRILTPPLWLHRTSWRRWKCCSDLTTLFSLKLCFQNGRSRTKMVVGSLYTSTLLLMYKTSCIKPFIVFQFSVVGCRPVFI